MSTPYDDRITELLKALANTMDTYDGLEPQVAIAVLEKLRVAVSKILPGPEPGKQIRALYQTSTRTPTEVRYDPQIGDTAVGNDSNARIYTVVGINMHTIDVAYRAWPSGWATLSRVEWEKMSGHKTGKAPPAAAKPFVNPQVGDEFQTPNESWWSVREVVGMEVTAQLKSGKKQTFFNAHLQYAPQWRRKERDPRTDPQVGDVWTSPLGTKYIVTETTPVSVAWTWRDGMGNLLQTCASSMSNWRTMDSMYTPPPDSVCTPAREACTDTDPRTNPQPGDTFTYNSCTYTVIARHGNLVVYEWNTNLGKKTSGTDISKWNTWHAPITSGHTAI